MLVMIRFSNIMLMMLNIQIFLSYFSQKCSMITYFLFLDKFLFFFQIFHLVLAEPGLGCCVQLSLVAESGAALCCLYRLLIAVVASLVVEHRL